MAADETRAIDRLPLLDEAERHQVLVAWNATRRTIRGTNACTNSSRRRRPWTPEATAVAYGDTRLTYAELDAGANRLGHRLRALNVRPGDRAAIALDRSRTRGSPNWPFSNAAPTCLVYHKTSPSTSRRSWSRTAKPGLW